VARENFKRAGVDERVEIIVGAALDTLPELAKREERFDLFFIDADKENNSAYVDWAIRLAAPGAVIVVDNIARMGRVLDPAADDHQARAVRDMLEMMGEHPRLDAAAIQTVGTKDWDGFAVAVVTEPVE
jgi:predicted O-methyltransferase YrrM